MLTSFLGAVAVALLTNGVNTEAGLFFVSVPRWFNKFSFVLFLSSVHTYTGYPMSEICFIFSISFYFSCSF